MLARGISPSEVVKAINAQSAIIPAGDIKIGDLDYYVYSNSLIDVVDKINDIPIKIVNGTPVLVRDIGTAADCAAIQTSIVRVNGREATYIPITRQEGANTLEVTDGIRAKLSKLTEIPASTTVKFIYDQSLYIRQAIANLQKEGLLGRRAGRPDDLSLPAQRQSRARRRPRHSSLAHRALVALYLTGQSVNIMTLGGLALVIGTLLDNNIVVQENLHRHLEMGKDGRSAAEDSATELTLPIFVATICILIVYLPIMFFTGIIKYLFVPLAMTVAFAMLADYAVSMSVTPVMLARLYQGGHGNSATEKRLSRRRLVSICPGGLRTAACGPPSGSNRWSSRSQCWHSSGRARFCSPGCRRNSSPGSMPAISPCWSPRRKGRGSRRPRRSWRRSRHLVQETIPKQELEEVISNTGLYYGDAARFAPNTGNHTAFVLVNLVTGHEGHTDDYITATAHQTPHRIARRRGRVSNRRDHQRCVELRPARPDRHPSRRPAARPHQAGGGRNPAESRAGDRIPPMCGSSRARAIRSCISMSIGRKPPTTASRKIASSSMSLPASVRIWLCRRTIGSIPRRRMATFYLRSIRNNR